MPFAKNVSLPSGLGAGYCVVEKAAIDIKNSKIELSVDVYKDQASYESGLEKAASLSYVVAADPNGQLYQAVIAFLEAAASAKMDNP